MSECFWLLIGFPTRLAGHLSVLVFSEQSCKCRSTDDLEGLLFLNTIYDSNGFVSYLCVDQRVSLCVDWGLLGVSEATLRLRRIISEFVMFFSAIEGWNASAFRALWSIIPAFSRGAYFRHDSYLLKTFYYTVIFPQVTVKWMNQKLVQFNIMTLNLVFHLLSEQVRKVYQSWNTLFVVKLSCMNFQPQTCFYHCFSCVAMVTVFSCSAAYTLTKARNEGARRGWVSEWRSERWGAEIFLTWLHSRVSGKGWRQLAICAFCRMFAWKFCTKRCCCCNHTPAQTDQKHTHPRHPYFISTHIHTRPLPSSFFPLPRGTKIFLSSIKPKR